MINSSVGTSSPTTPPGSGRATPCWSEAQAVLFDTKKMTDLDAARWWESNRHRFEQVKERVKREQQRAQSAQGTSRTRM